MVCLPRFYKHSAPLGLKNGGHPRSEKTTKLTHKVRLEPHLPGFEDPTTPILSFVEK
jgi:hypothetical protein